MPEFCQVDILLAIQQANLSLSNWLSTLFPSTIFLVLLTSVKVSISIDYYISAQAQNNFLQFYSNTASFFYCCYYWPFCLLGIKYPLCLSDIKILYQYFNLLIYTTDYIVIFYKMLLATFSNNLLTLYLCPITYNRSVLLSAQKLCLIL